MRTLPERFRLTFLLPGWLSLVVKPGRLNPCLHQCSLAVDPIGLVEVIGPSREKVFEQVQRFLKLQRPYIKDRPPFSIVAELRTPTFGDPEDPRARGGRDGWQIIVNASIAFSPTSMPPAFVPETSAATEAR